MRAFLSADGDAAASAVVPWIAVSLPLDPSPRGSSINSDSPQCAYCTLA